MAANSSVKTASKPKRPGVSAREQARRDKQRLGSMQEQEMGLTVTSALTTTSPVRPSSRPTGKIVDATPPPPQDDEDLEQEENENDDENDDQEPMSKEQAAALLETVNLDEVNVETVQVTLTEWAFQGEYDSYDDEGNSVKAKRFGPVPRAVLLGCDAPVDIQLRAMQLLKSRRKGLTDEDYMEQMTVLVLDVWRLTEPDMTLKRLRKGLGAEKIGRLFSLFFNPRRQQ